ncbi:MAG: protein-tyrosine-phosphatase [Lachnospiraceae bacterium]|nr:protein-tyrosine-phosphatase [Lachnospiraceae bacterium]
MGFIDMHSHVLPNMDDGSHSDEQSLEMLRIAYDEGTDVIYATPHNMPGKGRPSPEQVYAAVDRLQDLADDAGIPIQILPGTEYYFREEVMDIFEEDRAVPFGDSEYVLVEFDPMAERNYIRNSLRDIRGTNYIPVLAHIERYVKAMEDMEFVEGLQKLGVLIQVNAASVTGDNGWKAKADTKKLLKRHLVDFIGTDAHNNSSRAPKMAKCADILYKKYGSEYAEELLFGNAEYYFMKGSDGQ